MLKSVRAPLGNIKIKGNNHARIQKFAFDVGIAFLASVVILPLGFIITIVFGRYLGAGDLGLYRMSSAIHGIAMLVAAVGSLAAMIKWSKNIYKHQNIKRIEVIRCLRYLRI